MMLILISCYILSNSFCSASSWSVRDDAGQNEAALQYPYPKQCDPSWPGGGFPALPWAPNWGLSESTASFFLGNNTGQNNKSETATEAQLAVVGLGWQLGIRNPTDGFNFYRFVDGQLEQRQTAAAQALKKKNPRVRVMVSADMDCTAGFWGSSKRAMANSTLASMLFLHWPNGSVFYDEWGPTPAPWYNFSNPAAVDWWIHEGPIAEAMRNPFIDGVYLDGSNTGTDHAGRPVSAWGRVWSTYAEQEQYVADQKAALAKLVAVQKRLYPEKWLTGYSSSSACYHAGGIKCDFHCPQGSCAGWYQIQKPTKGKGGNPLCVDTMRLLISRQHWSNQTLYFSSYPMSRWACKDWNSPEPCVLTGTVDPSPYVAAFLVARGPSAILQLEPTQPVHLLDYFNLFRVLKMDVGVPLETAEETHPGVFKRKWSKMTVMFDCNTFHWEFNSTFASKPGSSVFV
eukprot:gnl/MRDRNA2_/MRDRNA2_143331_c0_seq1.p1 gnl/MRDRNA2_/MRDRNA2_143331_c0~~gnl/MRDRNA2_/MRDRNA2_143331_c0_seq1.p1  ORF type:complete len:456 (+),score=57.44 gnl/MRDRNA2_/MRDRNA2_143331_c0_seq1:49-1416(+)